ncbi:MAG: DUF309 domain-containing protein [Nitrosopumilaceae archaeon]|nr:DUF309 domain-containing protein [Nitrosopumilaceae archaeon]NIU01706.1 DUF309 domain-containing protein [Nitrosopumilaceae archaeon]NIU88108.1 DUF309 domain-containing protein [Nitrosopumilaceae archaeon]NIV66353.1 DUF309 domain-containing protein [Nitrosopumilaceae archaeon]NIX62308.1 DUF309 domain-containing protein [Nitrosopumilaceae archaeon]
MERYMLHLQNSHYSPKDAGMLLRKARDLSSQHDVTVRDCRVSSKYLEFDISIESEHIEDLIRSLKPLGKLDHCKHVVEEDIDKEDAINCGISYFNDERFWECHEVLEGVWKKCYEGEKDLVQGLILVAAALVHFQKNENDICLSIFKRALNKLSNSSGMYHKIDVDNIRDKISSMIDSQKITTFAI